jgi:hypothetical protein
MERGAFSREKKREFEMSGKSVFVKEVTPESGQLTQVDRFLKAQNAGSGRLIFALDATASRHPTWQLARDLTASMIREATLVPSASALNLQLVYFRGGREGRAECVASEWMTDAAKLARIMDRIECRAGYTQIGRTLEHAGRETLKAKVAAVVLIGDMVEDDLERIHGESATLGRLQTPVFAFQEGDDRIAETSFREIARLSDGVYARFDAGASKQLGELLRATAAFAVGGMKALEGRKDAGSKLLLGQLKGGGQ